MYISIYLHYLQFLSSTSYSFQSAGSTGLSPSWLSLVPSILLLLLLFFDTVVNGIVFFISLIVCY